MTELPLGEYIRQRRQDLQLTQQQLCEGICNTVTLSRIENSTQIPSRKRLAALLERLGIPSDHYFALLSPTELEMAALEKEIIDCNIRRNTAEGLQKLRELEAITEKDDTLTQQTILRSKVILGKEDGPYSPEEQLAMLLQAIRLTVPRFQPDQIEQFLYSVDEVKIINQIANVYSKLGQHGQALAIFRQLLGYVQSHFACIQQSNGALSMVAFSYALELEICEHFAEAVAIAELGWNACVKYGHYQYLPGLHHIIAECAHYLENDEKSQDFYRRAYYLYLALGDTKNIPHILEETQRYFGTAFQL